jgi:hypothetical protein
MDQHTTAMTKIEEVIMVLEDMIPGSIDDKFCTVVDIAEFLLLGIYREYNTVNENCRNDLPLPADLCIIISNYLDVPICIRASYYDYHLLLSENIRYYNELIKQGAQCRELMEQRRDIAKEIDIVKNDFKRNKIYVNYMLSFLGVRVNVEYKNRTIISDVKVSSIVIGYLDDATFTNDYHYYLYLLNIYYGLCDDISNVIR